jgi:feruloyl-CoA synthase
MAPVNAPLRFGPSDVDLIRNSDGTMIVKSPHRLGPYPRAMTACLEHWAATAPERCFLAQRDQDGDWRRVSFASARALARNIAQALLDRDLSGERPIAILSGNGIDHALLGLGAMYAGVPYASISPPYSLLSSDFGKLRTILGLLTPGLVFAADGGRFSRAIEAAVPRDVELVVCDDMPALRPATPFSALTGNAAGAAVDAAHARVGPDTIAKILFTSGSTGSPKGVVNTQRMLTSNQAMISAAYPSLTDAPPVLVDWLPWNHTFGANHNVGIVLAHGGTLYIDDGKPLPGAFEPTVRNLREIAPTAYYNVPKGFEMLLPYLADEPDLRRTFFSRLQFMFYAGASLSAHVRETLERFSRDVRGEPVAMLTSLGSTETAPSALSVTAKARAPGVVGIPNVGVELKLVPTLGKLAAWIRGPLVTPGYWRQPELSREAFDADGFYFLGDALSFANPADPEKGFLFDGRIAEDFKLASGTWVSVGPLRARIIERMAPLVRDAVIAGHDRDDVTALLIPDLDSCRAAIGADGAATAAEVLASPRLRLRVAELLARLNTGVAGSSLRVERVLLFAGTLSIDAGEITDKGSINQRVVIGRHAHLVAALYASDSEHVIGPRELQECAS